MLEQFAGISSEEQNQLKDAIALITILIAGADGKIEEDELAWAKKITDIRGYANPDAMTDFYDAVGKDFDAKLQHYLDKMPSSTAARNSAISDELAKLNPILAKLDTQSGAMMYQSYTSFAKHVAKATGGIMGFGSISKAEKELMELSTLVPIIYVEDEEA